MGGVVVDGAVVVDGVVVDGAVVDGAVVDAAVVAAVGSVLDGDAVRADRRDAALTLVVWLAVVDKLGAFDASEELDVVDVDVEVEVVEGAACACRAGSPAAVANAAVVMATMTPAATTPRHTTPALPARPTGALYPGTCLGRPFRANAEDYHCQQPPNSSALSLFSSA